MLESAEPARSVPRNLLHAFLAWGLPLATALATTPLIVGALGVEAYGLLVLVLGLGGQVVGQALGQALGRHVAASQAQGDVVRTSSLVSSATLLAGGLALVAGLGIGLGSTWIVAALKLPAALHSPAHAALLLTALGFPLAAWSQVFGALPRALQRYELYGRVVAWQAVGVSVVSVLLARAGYGIPALIGASLAGTALVGLAFALVARRLLPGARLAWRVPAAALRELVRFSGAVLACQACGILLLVGERFYLTRALGPAALAHYAVPMSLAMQFQAVLASLTGLLVPLSSQALARSDLVRVQGLYARGLRFTAALVALFVVCVGAGGRTFLGAWMGSAFAERSSGVLALHALTFGLLALATIPWHVAEGLARPAWNATLMLSWLLLAGCSMLVLTPAWGLEGAAAARLVGLAGLPLHAAWVERAVFGRAQVRLWQGLLLRLALPSLALFGLVRSFAGVAPSPWAGLLLLGLLSPPAFLLALWFSGYFPPDDRAWLLQRLGSLRRRA